MGKIARVEPVKANEKVRELLQQVQDRLGMIPNSLKVMANSPAMLKLALEIENTLGQGSLESRIREQIALAVSQINGSRYCVAAHSALAGIEGLSEEEIADARNAASPDRRTEAALTFAQELVQNRGGLTDDRIARMRKLGWRDGEIVEMIVQAAVTTLFNYLNRAAETETDFPDPAPGQKEP